MINLSRFETNPFDDEQNISMANFQQFAIDHVNRMKANNPGGVLTTVIADTEPVLAQFNIAYGSKTIEEALKKGATVNLGSNVDTMMEAARKLEKQVGYLFGVGSPVYISFFPQGLTEVNKATKGEWPTILERLKAATAARVAELGATVKTDWETFAEQYALANADQVGKKGTVDQLRALIQLDRKALARRMFINLHTVAIAFIDKPGSVATYFDQSIVERKQSSDSDGKGRLVLRVTEHNGDPLQSILIDIQDEQDQFVLMEQKTDENGEYRSSPLAVGRYVVTFRYPGIVTRTQRFDVYDDKDPVNEVQLTRE